MSERFDESASKSSLVVKDARTELDNAYTVITERLCALALVEGASSYESFIKTWNAVVEKYALSLKTGKKNDKADETKTVEE